MPPSESSLSSTEKNEDKAMPLNNQTQSEKEVETTPIKEAEALDKSSDEPEYPSGTRLVIITVSLCVSVLLMALDNTIIGSYSMFF